VQLHAFCDDAKMTTGFLVLSNTVKSP